MRSENLSSNKGSLFGLSGMWVKTLYRRDLIVAFVAFLAFFSATILPLILTFNDFGTVSEYYVSVMQSTFSPVPFIAAIYAIALSVMLFDYLHGTASAAGIHSFPVTRGKLFRSTVFTGTVLLLLPVLLTGIFLFVFGRIMPPSVHSDVVADPARVLSAVNVLKWFIDTAIGSLFTFAVANLAGIIAGKNIIHALLAYLLNGIAAVTCVIIDTYATSFILGVENTPFMQLAVKTHPFLWFMAEREGMLTFDWMIVIFIAVTVVITIFTGLLYKTIKLEREQDATVFPLVSDLLVIYCSFCSLSGIGLICAQLMARESATLPIMPFLIGGLIGSIPSFIIYRMIAESSVRIFNMRSVVNLAALAAVTAIVIALTCFDVTGQADRIPDASEVSRVQITAMAPFDNEQLSLSDSQSVSDVIGLHKAVLDSKKGTSAYSEDSNMTVHMSYTLKNGSTLDRTYYIKRNDADVNSAAEKLCSGDEYQSKLEVYIRKLILNADYASVYTGKAEVNIADEDIRPLLMAYLKDTRANGFTYYSSLEKNDLTVDNEQDYSDSKTGMINISHEMSENWTEEMESLNAGLSFGKKDSHVHRFLKKKGYDKEIAKQEAKFDGISE